MVITFADSINQLYADLGESSTKTKDGHKSIICSQLSIIRDVKLWLFQYLQIILCLTSLQ